MAKRKGGRRRLQIKMLSDNETRRMLEKSKRKCAFCGEYDTAFCCTNCRENARQQGEQDLLKALKKFERKEGSRCIEGSILFEIRDWNKFKRQYQK